LASSIICFISASLGIPLAVVVVVVAGLGAVVVLVAGLEAVVVVVVAGLEVVVADFVLVVAGLEEAAAFGAADGV
jgi:hypothetical protein